MSESGLESLRNLQPEKEFFIGIDSDGCAFDTMEIKHKECFIPNFIKYFNLQAVSKYAREAAEFANLYSKTRGQNRFIAYLRALDLLRERKEVQDRNVEIDDGASIKKLINSEYVLGNPGLTKLLEDFPDDSGLRNLEGWTNSVNEFIGDIVKGVPPYPGLVKALELATEKADVIVVSSTPEEALEREWEEHDVKKFVRRIGAQETGTKREVLQAATEGKYAENHTLMIGDAPGDYDAATFANALYFPINPGKEEKSWECFFNEAFGKFIDGTFAGEYQDKLIKEFEACLPENPPWEN